MNWNTVRTALLALAALATALMAHPLAAGDIGGKWNFTFDTEGGVRQSVIEIKQEGETLSATMGDAELAGTASADGFELAGKLYSPEAGYEAVLTMKGKTDGDRLAGNSDWDSHRATFTAVRAD